ncbi:MAG TPA: hypothetical protein VGQ03_03285 [Nitrososphaera sp.]|nr:hypothetical protein [Nitrososphaera sp.]
MPRNHRGMIAAFAILLVMALSVLVLTSPQTHGFLDMFGSGGLSPMSGITGQQGQSTLGMMPW